MLDQAKMYAQVDEAFEKHEILANAVAEEKEELKLSPIREDAPGVGSVPRHWRSRTLTADDLEVHGGNVDRHQDTGPHQGGLLIILL